MKLGFDSNGAADAASIFRSFTKMRSTCNHRTKYNKKKVELRKKMEN